MQSVKILKSPIKSHRTHISQLNSILHITPSFLKLLILILGVFLPARIPEHLILKHAKWCRTQTPGKIQKTSSQRAAGCPQRRSLPSKFKHKEILQTNIITKITFLINIITVLTENFTRGSNKIVCFGIFIYDSNQELTFNIQLSLPPGNKVKPSLMSFCKCYGARKQSAEAAPAFPGCLSHGPIKKRRNVWFSSEVEGEKVRSSYIHANSHLLFIHFPTCSKLLEHF